MNNPDTLPTMDCLGKIYCSQGKYAEAETILKQCIEKQRLLFGNTNPEVIRTKATLAEIYKMQGKFVEAMAIFKTIF